MSTRNNQTVDATGHQPFHPNHPREDFTAEKWHKPGVLASETDKADEFHAQTLPPGTAPAGSSYQPNPINEVPGQANNDDVLRAHGKERTYTNPLTTYPGATSKDVDNSFGKPAMSQTSNEQRHAGAEHHRKHHGAGLEGVGANAEPQQDRQKVDPRYNPGQRALDREEAVPGTRGGRGIAGAEELPPQTAESVARER
ncbi:conserved hypothetical protein [Talaromyces stipitatus ATCC 10500]|uniref:Uncharacterized protein n=1 Tax=Talaromyces stipitatus (strain ATCC 10500 / CBS 375.48 / QM 6759 / NRRL 1006) TaxID=441959 RepID=B8M3K1_TALSN|nr:uncharacterized protein TSTA_096220 [Talaromyces stipitatus ATCC 10500]EED22373.1 conserved hypothetical protein [Talaromyces stipitatus ATCC 10500]